MMLKLLEHVIKVVERIVEGLIREKVNNYDIQFGFMLERGTSDEMSTREVLGQKEKVIFAFVDLRLLAGYQEM